MYFYWWHHFEKNLVIVNSIKCKQTSLWKSPCCFFSLSCKQKIHWLLLVFLQPKLIVWVIGIYFIISFLDRTTEGTFSEIIYWTMMTILNLNCFYYVIYHYFSQKFRISDLLSFLSQFFEAVRALQKVLFPTSTYTSIGKYTIPVPYKQQTPNTRVIIRVSKLWWARS